MRFCLPLLFILFPILLFAQGGSITGKVARMDTKSALGKASIFLSNSSYGTVSNDDGTFTLSGIRPGQYELVVSMIGFEDYNQTVMVGKEPIKVDAQMMPKVTQLHEVVITTPENWRINYALFLKEFLGESDNAKKCRILNPHDISLVYRKKTKTLEAWSDDFIEIENKALGYKVKFLLKSFKADQINNIISWEGKVLYTELKASAAQKKLWSAKRDDIYYGSSMHFFRSVQNASLSNEGFVLYTLLRRPNPERPPQEVIQKKLDMFNVPTGNRDSVNRWIRFYQMSRYQDSLIRRPLKETDIARALPEPGLFGIAFPGCLYVVYTKKREDMDFKDLYRPLDMPNYQVSLITLYKPYALFDQNGSVVSSQSTLFEGTWSKNKIAELLPIDYVPGELVVKEDHF